MKKSILIVIIVFALISAVSVAVIIIPKEYLPEFLREVKYQDEKTGISESVYNPVDKTILYHNADYSYNIYDDEEFLDLMNQYALKYKENNIEYTLTKDKLDTVDDSAKYFYDYFNDIRNGDADKYNSYFADEYFWSHEKLQEFTMQEIYEICIEKLNVNISLDEKDYEWVLEKGIEPICFNVKYKIHKNNGTFRLGVNSDTVKPQMYILYHTKKGYKIIDIVDYDPLYK